MEWRGGVVGRRAGLLERPAGSLPPCPLAWVRELATDGFDWEGELMVPALAREERRGRLESSLEPGESILEVD